MPTDLKLQPTKSDTLWYPVASCKTVPTRAIIKSYTTRLNNNWITQLAGAMEALLSEKFNQSWHVVPLRVWDTTCETVPKCVSLPPVVDDDAKFNFFVLSGKRVIGALTRYM